MSSPSLLPRCFQHVLQPAGKEIALCLSLPIDDSSEPLQCCLQVPQAQEHERLLGGGRGSKGREVSEGQRAQGPGLEAARRPRWKQPSDTLLTHLQQEGDSQHAAQRARQPLQVPQQHPVASLRPEV